MLAVRRNCSDNEKVGQTSIDAVVSGVDEGDKGVKTPGGGVNLEDRFEEIIGRRGGGEVMFSHIYSTALAET